jgi:hypothetical protein
MLESISRRFPVKGSGAVQHPAIGGHSRHSFLTHRSAVAFALGARIGVRITCTPSAAKISSKARRTSCLDQG